MGGLVAPQREAPPLPAERQVPQLPGGAPPQPAVQQVPPPLAAPPRPVPLGATNGTTACVGVGVGVGVAVSSVRCLTPPSFTVEPSATLTPLRGSSLTTCQFFLTMMVLSSFTSVASTSRPRSLSLSVALSRVSPTTSGTSIARSATADAAAVAGVWLEACFVAQPVSIRPVSTTSVSVLFKMSPF